MKPTEVLERIEKIYRDIVLTSERVKVFNEAFTRLQDKVDRIVGEQFELRGRLANLEARTGELQGMRDKLVELDARFKATVENAVMTSAREGIREHVHEYLARHLSTNGTPNSIT